MRILRIFVGNDLSLPLNWALVENDTVVETGSSTFTELALFEEVALEVYLLSNCCSIFKASVQGISSKRMTEETILGLIEDKLVDEIDDVTAITLRTEDDIAYIAVFNRIYYETLTRLIYGLNKSVHFIQSFVFSTQYKDKCFTLFLSQGQRFLRISKYEYYNLDDSKPFPQLLEDIFTTNKPQSLLVYNDASAGYTIDQISEHFAIECIDATNQYDYGTPIWNFYIQKSTSFNLNLDKLSKATLKRLLNHVIYLSVTLIVLWALDIIVLSVDMYNKKAEIARDLTGIVPNTKYDLATMEMAHNKIGELRNAHGLYDGTGSIAMMAIFLQTVSTLTTDDIKQIDYSNKTMHIILGRDFKVNQFVNFKNILSTSRILASLEDYKTYSRKLKKNAETANNNLDAQAQTIDDAAWVITLRRGLWEEVDFNPKDTFPSGKLDKDPNK